MNTPALAARRSIHPLSLARPSRSAPANAGADLSVLVVGDVANLLVSQNCWQAIRTQYNPIFRFKLDWSLIDLDLLFVTKASGD